MSMQDACGRRRRRLFYRRDDVADKKVRVLQGAIKSSSRQILGMRLEEFPELFGKGLNRPCRSGEPVLFRVSVVGSMRKFTLTLLVNSVSELIHYISEGWVSLFIFLFRIDSELSESVHTRSNL